MTVAWLPTIRVSTIKPSNTYFELVEYATDCYSSFITLTSSDVRPTTESCNGAISKVFAWSYILFRELYHRIRARVPLLPYESPVLLCDSEPPKFLESSLNALADSPAMQLPEVDHDSALL